MKRQFLAGLVIGVLISGAVYAIGVKDMPGITVDGKLKIIVQHTKGDTIYGRIMVKQGDQWYYLENPGNIMPVK